MGWRDLLQTDHETVVSPWVGGRFLRTFDRVWTIEGDLPAEHGWRAFSVHSRQARCVGPVAADERALRGFVKGYVIGNRLVRDDIRVHPDPFQLCEQSEPVYLLPEDIDRFARIRAGRASERGPLVYVEEEMPLGPEPDVLTAYLDRAESIRAIAGIPPALDSAFRIETWRRARTEQRRREEEEQRERAEREAREQAERERRDRQVRQAQEEQVLRMVEALGNAHTRRQLAQRDFGEAARAALAVGGATYLDHRRISRRGEMAIRFRLNGRRFECTCQEQSLRIIDAGICLTNERTGERGDSLLTLESLPGVIAEAERCGVLVVFRHV